MNKKELFEKKLKADDFAFGLIKAQNDKILDFANDLDHEIDELQSRLERLKQIYEVYHGFCELGFSTRKEVGDAVCAYAMETAKDGADGSRSL